MSLSERVRRNLLLVPALMRNWKFVRFASPGDFYSPIPDASDVRSVAGQVASPADEELGGIDLNVAGQLQFLGAIERHYAEMPFPDTKTSGWRYFFDNTFFSYGDAIVLYSFIREYAPRRIIEIGSGYSSAAMLDLNERVMARQIDLTFIEPYPERLLGLMSGADKHAAAVFVKPVQAVDLSSFDALSENDILFVDSSHVAKYHSDVNHILFTILPRLAKGVLIHFHDIMWPFEYPRMWLEQGRAWNESYLLRAFLQYNASFRIEYFSSFVERVHSDALRRAVPKALTTPSAWSTVGNASLWLRKVV